MKTCEYAGEPFTQPRSHPWQGAVDSVDARYVDFKLHPELVRTSLEDYRPWEGYAAIETFYALVERLNRPGAALESNDCSFQGPADDAVDGDFSCSGRLMVLLRALGENVVPGRIEQLERSLHLALQHIDASFEPGVIGTAVMPTRYLALPEAQDQQLGSQLLISFWAWGDSEHDLMANLDRLLGNLTLGLGRLETAQPEV